MFQIPAGTIKTSCSVDLTDYPYDKQTCDIRFGSWSHNQDQINITTLGQQFWVGGLWYTNAEWNVINVKSARNDYNYPDYGVYTTLGLTLRLESLSTLLYLGLQLGTASIGAPYAVRNLSLLVLMLKNRVVRTLTSLPQNQLKTSGN
ncbi:unnamed protein product [Medioppia subpectinata]|uniref:Neurotransmitter-gated ion-channel ligand-binding domain-containing protein n=1 Tax=Medioppia subpectinata TaxID=1979941 RepID=A0A7R9KUA6_9ACAR|nr:unnamed protein product [Medioppia subpectinata]CAG2109828.1 unnamed protein product [Medioppia subpectinata]